MYSPPASRNIHFSASHQIFQQPPLPSLLSFVPSLQGYDTSFVLSDMLYGFFLSDRVDGIRNIMNPFMLITIAANLVPVRNATAKLVIGDYQ